MLLFLLLYHKNLVFTFLLFLSKRILFHFNVLETILIFLPKNLYLLYFKFLAGVWDDSCGGSDSARLFLWIGLS